jgi:plasmid replication initiation protein
MKPKRQYNQQPNIITKSTDEMTVIEKRIMYLVINRLDTGFNIQPDLFRNMEFTIAFNELKETNYTRVKKAIEKLQFRAITLIDDDANEEFERIMPFPHIKIKGSTVKLTMLSTVMPYFLELKSGFTKYSLAAALTLTSVYSQKLYELLSRWKDKREWLVSLEELQTLLNATNYIYADFKKRCLDVGTKELNEKTDLQVSWETEKTGKSVTDIRFFIKGKLAAENAEAKEAVQQELEQIRQLSPGQISLYTKKLFSEYSFTKKQQDLLLSNPQLFSEFVELESKIANGVIKKVLNPTAYMAKVLFKSVIPKGR